MPFSLEAASVGVLSEDEWFAIFDEYPASREITDKLAIFLDQTIKPYQERDKQLSRFTVESSSADDNKYNDAEFEKIKPTILEIINREITNDVETSYGHEAALADEDPSVNPIYSQEPVLKLLDINVAQLSDNRKEMLLNRIDSTYQNSGLSAYMCVYEEEEPFCTLYNITHEEKSEMKKKMQPALNALSKHLQTLPIHQALHKCVQIFSLKDVPGSEQNALQLFPSLYAKNRNESQEDISEVMGSILAINALYLNINSDSSIKDIIKQKLGELEEQLQKVQDVSLSDVYAMVMVKEGMFGEVSSETESPSLAVQVMSNAIQEFNMVKELAVVYAEVEYENQLQEKLKPILGPHQSKDRASLRYEHLGAFEIKKRSIQAATNLIELQEVLKDSTIEQNGEYKRLVQSLTETQSVKIGEAMQETGKVKDLQANIENHLDSLRTKGWLLVRTISSIFEKQGWGNISKIKRLRDKQTQTYQTMIQKLHEPQITDSAQLAEIESTKNIAICSLEIMSSKAQQIMDNITKIFRENDSNKEWNANEDPYLLALQQCFQDPDCPAEVKKARDINIKKMKNNVAILRSKMDNTPYSPEENTQKNTEYSARLSKEFDIFNKYMSNADKNKMSDDIERINHNIQTNENMKIKRSSGLN